MFDVIVVFVYCNFCSLIFFYLHDLCSFFFFLQYLFMHCTSHKNDHVILIILFITFWLRCTTEGATTAPTVSRRPPLSLHRLTGRGGTKDSGRSQLLVRPHVVEKLRGFEQVVAMGLRDDITEEVKEVPRKDPIDVVHEPTANDEMEHTHDPGEHGCLKREHVEREDSILVSATPNPDQGRDKRETDTKQPQEEGHCLNHGDDDRDHPQLVGESALEIYLFMPFGPHYHHREVEHERHIQLSKEDNRCHQPPELTFVE